jgi:copper(I)-binding protein
MRNSPDARTGKHRNLVPFTLASLRQAALALAITSAGLGLGIALPAGSASAHEYKAGTLSIGHPWARATPPGAKVGGGFLTITNNGSAADRLVAVESDVATAAEVHEMATENGVMKMRSLDKGLEIAPGATVKLAPGGLHVMFVNLKQPFKQGTSVKGTLVFEKAGRVPVEFKVETIAGKAPDAHHHHGGQTQ